MPGIQTTIVALIVIAAAAYVVWHFLRGGTCETCAHQCTRGNSQLDSQFVSIDELTQTVPSSCRSRSRSAVKEGTRFEP